MEPRAPMALVPAATVDFVDKRQCAGHEAQSSAHAVAIRLTATKLDL